MVALLAVCVRLSVGPLTIDDAYITFRYARNIALGNGFVYNIGEHVIGTTTPLWTIALACAYRVGLHDLPRVALILSSVADATTAVLLVAAISRCDRSRMWGIPAGILFAICPLSVSFAAGGMESSFFTMLVFGSAVASLHRRWSWALGLAGLATITRPEGWLLSVLVWGAFRAYHRRLTLRPIVLWGAPVLAWYGYALWWSGAVLSQSVTAKSVAYVHQTARTGMAFWTLVGLLCPG